MSQPVVKFCGISSLEDASDVDAIMHECLEQGAAVVPGFVGLVLWPKSKRLVTQDEAIAIREALDPSIRCVGVFVDASTDEVADLYEHDVIQVAQLHGAEDDAYIAELRAKAPGLEIWKAFEIKGPDDIVRANASAADMILLDGGKGEGNAFPHELLGDVSREFALAGGLSPDNVGAVVSKILAVDADDSAEANVIPACKLRVIDVSSGIEKDVVEGPSKRTRKDKGAMRRFLDEIERSTRAAKES